MQTYPTYKFRAECATDAQAIRAVLFPWLHQWSESRDNIEHEGVEYAAPDVIVEFSLTTNGPSLNEVRWLLDGVENGHVAAESVEHSDEYTGDRVSRRSFAAPAVRPAAEILGQAIAAARIRFQVLQLELDRTQNLIAVYNGASRAGTKWQPFAPDAPSPGWLAAVSGPFDGSTSIRRIAAPMGCKKWAAKGDAIVKARITTIGA